MPRSSRFVLISAKFVTVLTLAALLFGCGNPLNFRELLDGPEGNALTVNPSSGSLGPNDTVMLAVNGGHPPYEFSLIAGSGSLNDAQYTAPAVNSSETIEVTDSVGNTARASFSVDASGVSIGIYPAVSSTYTGDSIGFSYVGGTGPYAYAMVSNSSGGTIDPATGVYVAGPSPGADTVRITDTFDSSTDDATVNVVERTFAISPTSTTVTLGDSVDFNEIGGTGGFSWSLATDATGAMINTSTGSYTAGSVTGTDVVRVTDAYDGRTRDAIITVQASSFSTNVDYGFSGTPAVTSVGGDVRTGSLVTGTAIIENFGTAAGTQDITWYAFASTDTTVGGTDYLIDSGVVPSLSAGGTQSVPISGAWPAEAGSYYVLISISAPDDLALANNTGASGSTVAISKPLAIGPAAATVYVGQSIGFTGEGIGPFTYSLATNASGGTIDSASGAYTAGTTAGTDVVQIQDFDSTATASITVSALPTPPAADLNYTPLDTTPIDIAPQEGASLTETFTIHNDGPDDGTEDVVWFAYLSTDATISSDDDLVDSGTISGLPASTSSASITIDSGTWPAVTANTDYYLILDLRAADEPIGSTSDNALPVFVTVQNSQVDYSASAVISTGASVAGGALAGEFTLANTLADAGAADVTWKAYLSTDSNASISASDTLVATGTNAPLAGSPDSTAVVFTGTWRNSPGPYYLKAEVTAADDSLATNNIAVSGGLTTTAPDVDYVVSNITVASTATTGTAVTADFKLENHGTADGGAFVAWSAYASTDTTYDATDTLLDSSIATALVSGNSNTIPINGSWPSSADDYYLIVRVSAVDDIDGSNNQAVSAAVTATTSGVLDYVVTNITMNNPTVFVGDTISEFATIKNIGDLDGNTAVNNLELSTYISTDETLDGGDDLIVQAFSPGLVAGAERTNAVGWFNPVDTWPNAGTFYILAEATSTEEFAPEQANAVSAAGPFLVRPRPDLAASFYSTLPTSAVPGDPTETQYFRISEVNNADTVSSIEWSIVASEDQIFDPSDHVIDTGVIAPLAAGASRNLSWSGNWPTDGNQYNILAIVTSPDDNNPANDVAVEPDPLDVATYEFGGTKDIEPNNGAGPTTTATLEAAAVGISGGIDAGVLLKLGGSLDAALTRDTYKLVIGTAQSLEIWVEWATGGDELDLNVWDTFGKEWASFDASADREPSSGRLVISGWALNDVVYISIDPSVGSGSGDYWLHVVAK